MILSRSAINIILHFTYLNLAKIGNKFITNNLFDQILSNKKGLTGLGVSPLWCFYCDYY